MAPLRRSLRAVEDRSPLRRFQAMTSFARTKFQPPRVRAGTLIDRPQLEADLGRALLDQRLVLVCAPAGFGKTSVLARQIERLPAGTAVAWLSCDTDDSPVQLLECLAAALEPHDLPWRTDPKALIASAANATSREARHAIVVELINALDACDVPHGVIVVDDLHRVRHGMVYQFLALLLERFTARWTLVIASREEPPPLPLDRLRATGELADFHSAELRFNADESRTLAGRAGLDAAAAKGLQARTDGWPVGLRLALDMHRGGGPSAPGAHLIDRRMFDFLATAMGGWASWDWPRMQACSQRAAVGYLRDGRPLDALEAGGCELVALRAGGQRSNCVEKAIALREASLQWVDRSDWSPGSLCGNQAGYPALALLTLDRTWDAFDEGRLDELPGHVSAQMALLDCSTGADSLYRSLPLPLYAGMAGMHAPMLHYVQTVLSRIDRIPGELRTLARGLLGATRPRCRRNTSAP